MQKGPIRILHITDFHLFGNKKRSLLGVVTYDSLQEVIETIKNKHSIEKPDLILLTGDISQDYSLESYRFADRLLSDFDRPIFAIPGNHDDPNLFEKILCQFKNIDCINKSIICGNWRIILLNTQDPGKISGLLSVKEMNFLTKELAADTNIATLIFLHHHVLSIGCEWLDRINLLNADCFLEIMAKYNNIHAVICGHVHQECNIVRNNVVFLTTPSTCIQFAPMSANFKLDTKMPGYRWFELYSDNTYKTSIVRVEYNQNFIPDVNNREGY